MGMILLLLKMQIFMWNVCHRFQSWKGVSSQLTIRLKPYSEPNQLQIQKLSCNRVRIEPAFGSFQSLHCFCPVLPTHTIMHTRDEQVGSTWQQGRHLVWSNPSWAVFGREGRVIGSGRPSAKLVQPTGWVPNSLFFFLLPQVPSNLIPSIFRYHLYHYYLLYLCPTFSWPVIITHIYMGISHLCHWECISK